MEEPKHLPKVENATNIIISAKCMQNIGNVILNIARSPYRMGT